MTGQMAAAARADALGREIGHKVSVRIVLEKVLTTREGRKWNMLWTICRGAELCMRTAYVRKR